MENEPEAARDRERGPITIIIKWDDVDDNDSIKYLCDILWLAKL